MRVTSKQLWLVALLLTWAHAGRAQTADEVIERSIAAIGGRAALGKLTSQTSTGTITLALPTGPVSGTVEILAALPNRSRSLIKVDLSAVGAGLLVLDQRFDGTSGYAMDSLQGDREITGNQLDNLRNGSFPTPLLNYKKLGATATVGPREKVGDRDAYPVSFDFPAGSVVRQYIDAETWLPIKVVVKIDVPQIGRGIEQVNELLDYREVGGIKVPFEIRSSSEIQNFTLNFTRIEFNLPVDGTLFKRPAKP